MDNSVNVPSSYLNEDASLDVEENNEFETPGVKSEGASVELSEDSGNNIDTQLVSIAGTEDVISDKLDSEDPYVLVLKESIPTDVSTRRRIAYTLLRSMLLSKKGQR